MKKMLFILLCFTACKSGVVQKMETFYPIEVGSYWVWVDTFTDEEAYQNAFEMTDGKAATGITKDSILQVISTKNTQKVVIKTSVGWKESNKTDITIDTLNIDSKGVVTQGSYRTFLINPQIGDTLQTSPSTIVVKEHKEIGKCDCLKVSPPKKKFNYSIKYICKGIGTIGNVRNDRISRLVEYRIGTGPVIKKTWSLPAFEDPK